MVLASLTVPQLQALVIAIAGALVVLIPVLGGVVILAVQQWGKVKEAWGQLDGIKHRQDGQHDLLNTLTAKMTNGNIAPEGAPSVPQNTDPGISG